MADESFVVMLTGGHPNSLGRTVEVVDSVLADTSRFAELFGCYQSDDAVVRLRTSSAMKRVAAANVQLLVPYIDRFYNEIAALDQASAQWTLADLAATLRSLMTPDQHARALAVLQHNLTTNTDWIVLNTTMETLHAWAAEDPALRAWLVPHLERLSRDPRKSVAGRARKYL